MANIYDVLIATIGIIATLLGGGLIIKLIINKNKNQSKIKQFGIGNVHNNATVNQVAKNESNGQTRDS